MTFNITFSKRKTRLNVKNGGFNKCKFKIVDTDGEAVNHCDLGKDKATPLCDKQNRER